MPPRPGHHLDLFLVPTEGRELPDPASTSKLLTDLGFVEEGQPGPRAEHLIPGGFRRARVDRPEGLRLYANGQGGFRVSCPDQGDNIVPAFQRAVSAWRSGGPLRLDCPACGQEHGLQALDFAPPAAFGRGALVLTDVASAAPQPEGLAALQDVLGPLVVVGSRR